MKSTCRSNSRSVCVGAALVAVAALFAVLPASAQVDMPYADSFESYTNNTPLNGTNGWLSVVETAAVVIVQGYDFPLRKPLESEAHTKIVHLTDGVTNFLNHTPGADSNLWVDLMVLPLRSSVTPEVDDDIQVALYFNDEGHIVIRHRYFDAGAGYATPAAWSELMHPPQPTDEWARVTIRLNYMPGPYLGEASNVVDRFFQVMLNGSEPLTHPLGYKTAPFDFNAFDANTNGGWFLFMNTGGTNNSAANDLGPTNINSVAIQGTGYFDDFVVTNSDVFAVTPTRWLVSATSTEGGTIYPGGNLLVPDGTDVTFSIIQTGVTNLLDVLVNGISIGPTNSVTLVNVTSNQTVHASFIAPTYTDRGVSVAWLESYGLTEGDEEGDEDNDGAKNWEEYVAGTVPTNSNSVFVVLSVMYGAGSNRVTWFGTLDSGVTNYFSMLRSTNELPANIWELVLSNSLPRDVSGTNVWWDTNPPENGKVFYRPTILWNIE